MKNSKFLLPLFMFVFFLTSSCGNMTVKDVLDAANKAGVKGPAYTEGEAGSALKEALTNGISKGADKVSLTDGFFKNMEIKLPFPPDAKKMEDRLRSIGMGKLCDDIVLSINRGAEQASKEAKPIFVEAIRGMTITDAINIVKGQDNAATSYLKTKTSAQLTAKFKPVIEKALANVSATKYWTDAINTYNKIPLIEKMNPDLAGFVTQKAIDGLFIQVAKEEKNIRIDPIARTTEILRKVFGAPK